MIGVGNEQWGPRYLERYRFSPTLKASIPKSGGGDAGPAPGAAEETMVNWRQQARSWTRLLHGSGLVPQKHGAL
jgi:hypothetical protein